MAFECASTSEAQANVASGLEAHTVAQKINFGPADCLRTELRKRLMQGLFVGRLNCIAVIESAF
jgi:hypothetical protein